ncbi:hypothetical protein [Streptomyces prunicolor]|uniref:hypothetical protein n=1 Tax=Streptomyces prunicolor TaxID=67348 RepID=UPI00036ACE59|nr:hypothetical protein [Streptomyces prunicolor]
MGNKKNTVKAAKAEIKRDTKKVTDPKAERTQGALADRHVRHHTPDSLYGEDSTS